MFEGKYIDELIEDRRVARENKNWQLSDEIRNYLDEKFVFVFDIKGNDGKPFQEVHYLFSDWFYEISTYKEKYNEDGVTKERTISETRMERTERMRNVKFKSKREFVEWNTKKDIASQNRADAWVYSMLQSNQKSPE